ncbi:MAG: hypothetical protein JNL28_05645 [Planctomycetes bacterium]|nr:hypothetical protein [Planctomycetota bacterium]
MSITLHARAPRTSDPPRKWTQHPSLYLLALASLSGAAHANKISTYTSTSNCNSTNTGWTVTNTCTSTTSVGDNPPHLIQSGVQYSSLIPGLVPTATIRDQYGNPIVLSGAVLTLVPSAAVKAKVTAERGLLSPLHEWAGFESNLALDPPNTEGTTSTVYVITFTWMGPVLAQGAVWCSNNDDDLYGNPVYDGYQVLPGTAGTPFCSGDGTATACPCANSGAAFNGCANSINAVGAHLGALGNASVAGDTLVLYGSGMASGGVGLYFQGTAQINGGAGSVFGDGLLCIGGNYVRLGVKFSPDGWSQYPAPGDLSLSSAGALVAGDVRHYQLWYRDSAVYCTVSTFNLTNGHRVVWGP